MKQKLLLWVMAIIAGFGVFGMPGSMHAQSCSATPEYHTPVYGYREVTSVYLRMNQRDSTSTPRCTCSAIVNSVGCSAGETDAASGNEVANWEVSCDLPCSATIPTGGAIQDLLVMQSSYFGGNGELVYQCPGTTRGDDGDGDGYPDDADVNDKDYRILLSENVYDGCDGIDNDGDGCVDEGFSAENYKKSVPYPTGGQCYTQNDFKRLWDNGHDAPEGQVNLREGWALRMETDASIEGPLGPLDFTRYFNSGANYLFDSALATDKEMNPLGKMWSHDYNIWLKQDEMYKHQTSPTHTDQFIVHMGDGSEHYFSCIQEYDGNYSSDDDWTCNPSERVLWRSQGELEDAHLVRHDVSGHGVIWEFYPGDGTVYRFRDENGDDLDFAKVAERYDMQNDALVWEAEYDTEDRLEYVRTADSNTYYRFEYDSNDFLRYLHAEVGGRGEEQIAEYRVDSTYHWLYQMDHATTTVGAVSPNVRRTFEYDSSTGELLKVKDKIDNSTDRVTSEYTWDSNGKVASVRGSDIWAEFFYTSLKTEVTYKNTETYDLVVNFTHNGGRYISERDKDFHRSSIPRYIERDSFGRPTCVMSDDGRMTKFVYKLWGNVTTTPERHTTVVDYGTTSHCADEPSNHPNEPLAYTNGAIQRVHWMGEMYDATSKSWRRWYESERSPSSGLTATDCELTGYGTGAIAMDNGCTGVAYEYADATSLYEAQGPLERVREFYYTELPDGSPAARVADTYYGRGDTCSTDPDYQYDWQVCLITQKGNTGNIIGKTHFDYDGDGLVEATTVFSSSTNSYTSQVLDRDIFGRVIEAKNPAGVKTEYTLSAMGTPLETIVTGAYRDQSGTDTSQTTKVQTNNMGLPVEVVSPLGNYQKFTYKSGANDYARLDKTIQKSPTGAALSAVHNYYTQQGFLDDSYIIEIANEPNCSGSETCTIAVARNRAILDAVGRATHVSKFTTNLTIPADYTANNVYDSLSSTGTGKLVLQKDFMGNERTYTYDNRGRLENVTSDIAGLSAEMDREYDDMSRPDETTSPTNVETKHTYNDRGQLVKESSLSQGDRYFEYDDRGVATRTIHVDYQQSITASNRKEVCYAYDWLGRMQSVDEDCDGSTDWTLVYDESFEWCNSGDTSTNIGKLTSLYSGDANGIHRKWCHYAGGSVEKEFTSATNVFWDDPEDADVGGFVMAVGTQYVYDNAGRLTNKFLSTYPYGHDMATREIAYSYDSERVGNVDHIKTRVYGAIGWESWVDITSTEDDPVYSVFGLEELTLANGLTLEYTRDASGRITNKLLDDGSTTVLDLDQSFDGNGNLLTSIDTGYTGIARYFEYDGLNRLLCESQSGEGCPEDEEDTLGSGVRYAFNYDLSNNRTKRRTELGGTTEEDYEMYTYSDRLIYWGEDDNDHYILYDDQGNIEVIKQPTANTDQIYEWNVFNQLEMACSDGTYGESNCTENYYEYAGPAGQMFARYTSGGGSYTRSNFDREFYWSGPQIDVIREFVEEDENFQYYIWLGGMPIAKVDTEKEFVSEVVGYTINDGDVTWIHTDHIGAPILGTDDEGDVVWEWDRSPYGRNTPSSSIEIALRFPGQIYDDEAKVNYNQHRWYSPLLGAYISSDPIGIRGGLNYFGYASANPTSRTDVLGLSPDCEDDYIDEDGNHVIVACKPEAKDITDPTGGPADGLYTPGTRTSSDTPPSRAKVRKPGGYGGASAPSSAAPAQAGVVHPVNLSTRCRAGASPLECYMQCQTMFDLAESRHRAAGTQAILAKPFCPGSYMAFPPGGLIDEGSGRQRMRQPYLRLVGCRYHGYTLPSRTAVGAGLCQYVHHPENLYDAYDQLMGGPSQSTYPEKCWAVSESSGLGFSAQSSMIGRRPHLFGCAPVGRQSFGR